MLRKSLIAGMVVCTVLPLFVAWWKVTETAPQSRLAQMGTPKPNKPLPKVHPLIQKINARNQQISSFSCSDMNIKVWQNGMRFRLKGALYYEKPLNFRMQFRTIFGDEVDIGSNDDLFWYWSRRDKRKGLHFAKHEDYNRTRLKTPFNPLFIKESLGLSQINVKNAYVTETDSSVIIVTQFLNSVGKPVLRYTFINKANQNVEGFLITDKETNNPIAIAEVFEYDGGMPKKILYTWYEENKILYLEFVNPSLNVQIDPIQWQMPNIQPQINMGDQ